jgi:hypothetical protein
LFPPIKNGVTIFGSFSDGSCKLYCNTVLPACKLIGTLVAMRAPVMLDNNGPMSLQAGRTVLQYNLQLPSENEPKIVTPFLIGGNNENSGN